VVLKDFLGACAQVAVVAEDRGQFRRISFCDFRYGAEENREPDREDAFFAARENASTKIKSSQRGFFNRRDLKISGDEPNLFGLFCGGGYGLAELSEGEHAEYQYRTGAFGRNLERKIALACLSRFTQNDGGLKRFNSVCRMQD